MRLWRTVIDTNVLFEGLTSQGSACGLILEAWSVELFQPCVSNALIYEYFDVLPRKLSVARWAKIGPVLGRLLTSAEYVNIHFSWRPSTPDPGDDHVVDCAMNAGAIVITSNMRDFQQARTELGLSVLRPAGFLSLLDLGDSPTTDTEEKA